MLRLLFTPDWKIAAGKLEKIALWHTNSRLVTYYKKLAILVANDCHKKMESYITAMMHATLTPELLLKYLILVHLCLQELPQFLSNQPLVDFLGYLLQSSAEMSQHFAELDEKEEGRISCIIKPVCSHSASTRSEELVLCKEVFLISTVVRPYIAFLLKLAMSLQPLERWKQRKGLQQHEAWSVVNLLKMVVAVSGNFTMIGRYYIKAYGYLVVLLSKALAACLRIFMQILGKFVYAQLKHYASELAPDCHFQNFITLLQEVTLLNDQLMPLYHNKYFFDHLQDLHEPRWINTSAPEFDHIFQLSKSYQKSTPSPSPALRDKSAGKPHSAQPSCQVC